MHKPEDILVQVLVTDTEYAVTITDRESKPISEHPATYSVLEGKGKIAFSIDLTGTMFNAPQAAVEPLDGE